MPQLRGGLFDTSMSTAKSIMARRVIGAFLAIALLLNCLYWYLLPRLQVTLHPANNAASGEGHRGSSVVKVSMFYGDPEPFYLRAFKSHESHAQRWGVSMKVLRQDLVGGLWNKPAYLLSLVLQELEKPHSERAKWLMFVLPQESPSVFRYADIVVTGGSMPIPSS
jgi:hypothetical protein